MAFIVVEVEISNQSIADLNDKVQRAGKPHETVNNLTNLLDALKAGALDGTVQVTTRDTTATVTTSGTGSQQEDYTL